MMMECSHKCWCKSFILSANRMLATNKIISLWITNLLPSCECTNAWECFKKASTPSKILFKMTFVEWDKWFLIAHNLESAHEKKNLSKSILSSISTLHMTANDNTANDSFRILSFELNELHSSFVFHSLSLWLMEKAKSNKTEAHQVCNISSHLGAWRWYYQMLLHASKVAVLNEYLITHRKCNDDGMQLQIFRKTSFAQQLNASNYQSPFTRTLMPTKFMHALRDFAMRTDCINNVRQLNQLRITLQTDYVNHMHTNSWNFTRIYNRE